MLVGHIGLCQQHIHVTRHTPSHRVDRIGHLDAVVFQQLGEFAQGVLGLGHCQAVAGHKHHALSGLEGKGAFLSAAAGDAGVAGLLAATAHRCRPTKGASKQDAHQGAVHGGAHHLGEDQARSTHHGAGHNQQLAANHETCSSCGHAGIGVEQRDHHRHVGTADRQGDADTQ